jgi:hypothetical protein
MNTRIFAFIALIAGIGPWPVFAAPAIQVETVEVAHAADDKLVLEIRLNRASGFDPAQLHAAFPADSSAEPAAEDFQALSAWSAVVSAHDGKWLKVEFAQTPGDAQEADIQYGDGRIVAVSLVFGETQAFRANAKAAAAYCRPQCTDHVYGKTGINFTRCWGKLYGDAGQWYSKAKQCGFETSGNKPADRSILELSSPAHVIYIEDSKKLSGSQYRLGYSDRNWDGKCGFRSGTASYDRDRRQISFGGKWYGINGFITRW